MTNEDKNQDNEILRIRDSPSRKVPWVVFVWAISILFTVLVAGFGLAGDAASKAQDEAKDAKTTAQDAKDVAAAIKGDVGVIQNDVKWIREYLDPARK